MPNNSYITISGIVIVIIGALVLGNSGYDMEDTEQIWRPIADYDTRFYQVVQNDGDVVVVGYSTTDETKLDLDPQDFYEAKLIESQEMSILLGVKEKDVTDLNRTEVTNDNIYEEIIEE
jgi:hypothetical protein